MIKVELHGYDAEIGDYGSGIMLGSYRGIGRKNRMPTPTEMREYAEFLQLLANVLEKLTTEDQGERDG